LPIFENYQECLAGFSKNRLFVKFSVLDRSIHYLLFFEKKKENQKNVSKNHLSFWLYEAAKPHGRPS
jgi:hypothetical protein